MPNNHFSITNLAASDVVNDRPTENYCVLNSLDISAGTLSEGNLKYVNASGWDTVRGTIGVSTGKWYWEVYAENVSETQSWIAGILEVNKEIPNTYFYYPSWSVATYGNSYGTSDANLKVSNGTNDSFTSGLSEGDVVGFSLDLDSGTTTLDVAVNGVDKDTLYSSLAAVTYAPALNMYNSSSGIMNFGQDPFFAGGKTSGQDTSQSEFYYAPPSGFKALSTGNLPIPTIAKPAEHFDIKTWTATSTNPKVLDFPWSFASDGGLVWQKMRNSSGAHHLFDTVRGDNKGLYSNLSDVENASGQTEYYTQDFDSSGDYSIQQDGAGNEVNYSGNTYVAWGWKAGTSPSTSHTYALRLDLTTSYGGGWGDSGSYDTPRLKVYEDRGSGNVFLGYATVTYSDDYSASYVINTNNKLAIEIVWEYDDSDGGMNAGSPSYPAGTLKDGSTTMATWVEGTPDVTDGATFIAKTSGQTATGTGTLVTWTGGATGSSYNADAGFSIVTYTGNDYDSAGTEQTIDHNLGVVPEMVIVKGRTDVYAMTVGWGVYHKDLTADNLLFLNSTGAEAPQTTMPITSITATSAGFLSDSGSGFNFGGDSSYSADDYVCYFFASKEGYSKVGKYIGNGSFDGPMVTLSFRPAFILIKRIDGTAPWRMFDDKRPTYNDETYLLHANAPSEELEGYPYADFLSNGFKIRDNGSYINATYGEYAFYAVAESPFKYANAR